MRFIVPTLALLSSLAIGLPAATIQGECKLWHDIVLTFDGPQTDEQATPNPFLQHRLNVTFTNGERSIVIPGYFAADGNAAETSATSGNKWRVHFVPDATGRWTYRASFRSGPDVAVSLDPQAGEPGFCDGESGAIEVAPTDKLGIDSRARGMLRYVGKHFLRYAGSGDYYVMVGTQSPENLLAYFEFDNTVDRRGQKGFPSADQLHHYEPHLKDWRAGDPTWQGGKGKGIIGALNYLASKGLNACYSLTMNNHGDTQDINPWIDYDEHARYDVSKLGQWEIVLSHMDRLGIGFHVITQEEEGEQLLGKLTTERKLYYRELVARFAHHHAIFWDLDEEMDRWRYFTTQDVKDLADYLRALDPYQHPIQYVQWKAELIDDLKTYGRLLGYRNFDSTALQHDAEQAHSETIKWLDRSAAAGHPWLVNLIEMNPGVEPDAVDPTHDKVRQLGIWGHYLAGGSGTMFFFTEPNGDGNCEDFRSRDGLFTQMKHAQDFVTRYLPFVEMRHRDELTALANDYVLAKENDTYAVYLPAGGTTELNLSGATGAFEVKWYDPRDGGALQDGSIHTVSGGAIRSLGQAPHDTKADWAILVRRAKQG